MLSKEEPPMDRVDFGPVMTLMREERKSGGLSHSNEFKKKRIAILCTYSLFRS